jgi:hypothetical protein
MVQINISEQRRYVKAIDAKFKLKSDPGTGCKRTSKKQS